MTGDAIRDANDAWRARLGEPVSLARVLDFAAAHPRAFGAPAATTTPFVAGDFTGEVARGASCNCRAVHLVPHCNGTHTESAAHLTTDTLRLTDFVPLEPLPALLLDVTPVLADGSGESADPSPRKGDLLVTAAAIRAAWPAAWRADVPTPRVLVLRTGAHDGAGPAPYLSLEAAALIVAHDIDHLVLELPSVDRAEDDGRLAAHRVLFGLPPVSTSLAEAARAHVTVTELAVVPARCVAGPCAVQLQLTPWTGDAVPSRPVYFALRAHR